MTASGSLSARRRGFSAWPRARSGSGPTRAACPPSTPPAATAATAGPTSRRSSSGPARPVRSGPGRSSSSAPPAPAGQERSGPLILLVDDDAQVREVVRINLEFEGYTVREAADANEGLTATGEAKPDLVLLAVMVARGDGWEMVRLMQDRSGVGAIPVVMFSGK